MWQKIHYLFYVVVLLTLVTFTGCNNKAFDFSQLDEIDSNGDWGFPLLNAEYTIGDIIELSDDIGYIQQGSDGTLEIRYEYEFDSIISTSEYLESYFNSDIVADGTTSISSADLPPIQGNVQILYVDTIVAQFPTDMILLESASLKSGQMVLHVDYNVTQPTQLTVSCPQLTNAMGQPLHLEAQSTGGSYTTTVDISGYTLTVPSNNEIDIFMEVSCVANTGSLPNEMLFNYSATFQQIVFREIRGKFALMDLPVDKEWDFDSQFLRDHISGDMTLLNPQVKFEVFNSFPIRGSLVFEQAELSGGGNTASLLAYSPETVEIPANTNQFVQVNLPIANSLLLSPDYSHFKLKGNAVINPEGFSTPTLVFREDQCISMRITVVLPFNRDMNDIMFCDTLQFGGITLPSESAFSNMLLRLGITNGLPINFQLQAYFYDSQTATVKDSLFSKTQLVLSAVEGTPRFSELFASKDDYEEVKRMFDCDKIILRARLYTDGSPITINVSQAIRFQLGARMNVDLNGLVNLGN